MLKMSVWKVLWTFLLLELKYCSNIVQKSTGSEVNQIFSQNKNVPKSSGFILDPSNSSWSNIPLQGLFSSFRSYHMTLISGQIVSTVQQWTLNSQLIRWHWREVLQMIRWQKKSIAAGSTPPEDEGHVIWLNAAEKLLNRSCDEVVFSDDHMTANGRKLATRRGSWVAFEAKAWC